MNITKIQGSQIISDTYSIINDNFVKLSSAVNEIYDKIVLDKQFNNYYPTEVTWEDGTKLGPIGNIKLSGTNNIVEMEEIPVASNSHSGVVSTSNQKFSGNKTFNNAIYISEGSGENYGIRGNKGQEIISQSGNNIYIGDISQGGKAIILKYDEKGVYEGISYGDSNGNSSSLDLETITSNLKDALAQTEATLNSEISSINRQISNLSNQIDGAVTNWFGETAITSVNDKSSNDEGVHNNTYHFRPWKSDDDPNNDTDSFHEGDIYVYKSSANKSNRACYIYKLITLTNGKNIYQWVELSEDEYPDVINALIAAIDAQSTADGKQTTYNGRPNPPYQLGDIWFVAEKDLTDSVLTKSSDGKKILVDNTTDPVTYAGVGELLFCNNSKTSNQKFSISDWGPILTYINTNSINDKLEVIVEELYNQTDSTITVWSITGITETSENEELNWLNTKNKRPWRENTASDDDIDSEHEGDIAFSETTKKAYEYIKYGDNSFEWIRSQNNMFSLISDQISSLNTSVDGLKDGQRDFIIATRTEMANGTAKDHKPGDVWVVKAQENELTSTMGIYKDFQIGGLYLCEYGKDEKHKGNSTDAHNDTNKNWTLLTDYDSYLEYKMGADGKLKDTIDNASAASTFIKYATDDGVISITEKITLRKEWNEISGKSKTSEVDITYIDNSTYTYTGGSFGDALTTAKKCNTYMESDFETSYINPLKTAFKNLRNYLKNTINLDATEHVTLSEVSTDKSKFLEKFSTYYTAEQNIYSKISGKTAADVNTALNEVTKLDYLRDALTTLKTNIESQLDGIVTTWFRNYNINTTSASDYNKILKIVIPWDETPDNDDSSDDKNHIGDIYVYKSDDNTDKICYEFTSDYTWKEIDEDKYPTVAKALFEAADAKAAADGAINTYYQSEQPSGTNYGSGDIWIDSDDGKTYYWNGTKWTSLKSEATSKLDDAFTVEDNAVKYGETTVTGGLTLGNMLFVKSEDGTKTDTTEVTGGLSGISNDNVGLFLGCTYEGAYGAANWNGLDEDTKTWYKSKYGGKKDSETGKPIVPVLLTKTGSGSNIGGCYFTEDNTLGYKLSVPVSNIVGDIYATSLTVEGTDGNSQNKAKVTKDGFLLKGPDGNSYMILKMDKETGYKKETYYSPKIIGVDSNGNVTLELGTFPKSRYIKGEPAKISLTASLYLRHDNTTGFDYFTEDDIKFDGFTPSCYLTTLKDIYTAKINSCKVYYTLIKDDNYDDSDECDKYEYEISYKDIEHLKQIVYEDNEYIYDEIEGIDLIKYLYEENYITDSFLYDAYSYVNSYNDYDYDSIGYINSKVPTLIGHDYSFNSKGIILDIDNSWCRRTLIDSDNNKKYYFLYNGMSHDSSLNFLDKIEYGDNSNYDNLNDFYAFRTPMPSIKKLKNFDTLKSDLTKLTSGENETRFKYCSSNIEKIKDFLNGYKIKDAKINMELTCIIKQDNGVSNVYNLTKPYNIFKIYYGEAEFSEYLNIILYFNENYKYWNKVKEYVDNKIAGGTATEETVTEEFYDYYLKISNYNNLKINNNDIFLNDNDDDIEYYKFDLNNNIVSFKKLTGTDIPELSIKSSREIETLEYTWASTTNSSSASGDDALNPKPIIYDNNIHIKRFYDYTIDDISSFTVSYNQGKNIVYFNSIFYPEFNSIITIAGRKYKLSNYNTETGFYEQKDPELTLQEDVKSDRVSGAPTITYEFGPEWDNFRKADDQTSVFLSYWFSTSDYGASASGCIITKYAFAEDKTETTSQIKDSLDGFEGSITIKVNVNITITDEGEEEKTYTTTKSTTIRVKIQSQDT